MITPSGIVTTVAGSGEDGYSGDGGPAVQAELSWPYALAVDRSRNLYVADFMYGVIRKIDSAGTITTFAGSGPEGSSGDGGPAIRATLDGPSGLALDRKGNLYVTEGLRIRRIDSAGIITTVAGTGEKGTGGNGGPAILAQFTYSSALAIDNQGNLFVTEAVGSVCRHTELDPQDRPRRPDHRLRRDDRTRLCRGRRPGPPRPCSTSRTEWLSTPTATYTSLTAGTPAFARSTGRGPSRPLPDTR